MAITPIFSTYTLKKALLITFFTCNFPILRSLELTDTCAAYVSVLVETDDAVTFATLCKQLLAALKRLRECCDAELPSHLVEQLIAGEKIASCVPDCWQDTALQVDYAVALTLAVMGGTLPASVAKELTGLLHDMVWLLADFVKEPYITAH